MTPSAAAAIVEGKLKAREAAEAAVRANAAERAAEEKAWRAQAKTLIAAAVEGSHSLVITRYPIRSEDLLRLGFKVFKCQVPDD